MQRTLPSTFRWGHCLRTLHSTRIAFPSLPPLLLPCQDLVDLQLHEIPSSGYFSPEEFTNALSGTPQLRSLTLHLLSLPRRRSYLGLPPPPGERIVLAALTHLKYRGTSKYLDVFVARIEAPRLGNIEITLFSQPTMDALQLALFIQRTEMHTSFSHAKVETSAHAVSISFSNSGASTPFHLQISSTQLDWQLSCMAQICEQISPYLLCVGEVGVITTQPLCVQDNRNGEHWSGLLHSFKFRSVTNFWTDGKHTGEILCALRSANEENTAMLSSLINVHVREAISIDGPSWDSVQSFITARLTSGRPVEVKAPSYQCHLCRDHFRWQFGLKRHLRDEHGYQILCSYCGKFECTPGELNLFQEHLDFKHPEIECNDAIISKYSSSHLNLWNIIYWHSFLRPPPSSHSRFRQPIRRQ